jgi:hypothetical protein
MAVTSATLLKPASGITAYEEACKCTTSFCSESLLMLKIIRAGYLITHGGPPVNRTSKSGLGLNVRGRAPILGKRLIIFRLICPTKPSRSCHNSVVRVAFHSGASGFNSRPGDRLFWLWIFVVFLLDLWSNAGICQTRTRKLPSTYLPNQHPLIVSSHSTLPELEQA